MFDKANQFAVNSMTNRAYVLRGPINSRDYFSTLYKSNDVFLEHM